MGGRHAGEPDEERDYVEAEDEAGRARGGTQDERDGSYTDTDEGGGIRAGGTGDEPEGTYTGEAVRGEGEYTDTEQG